MRRDLLVLDLRQLPQQFFLRLVICVGVSTTTVTRRSPLRVFSTAAPWRLTRNSGTPSFRMRNSEPVCVPGGTVSGLARQCRHFQSCSQGCLAKGDREIDYEQIEAFALEHRCSATRTTISRSPRGVPAPRISFATDKQTQSCIRTRRHRYLIERSTWMRPPPWQAGQGSAITVPAPLQAGHVCRTRRSPDAGWVAPAPAAITRFAFAALAAGAGAFETDFMPANLDLPFDALGCFDERDVQRHPQIAATLRPTRTRPPLPPMKVPNRSFMMSANEVAWPKPCSCILQGRCGHSGRSVRVCFHRSGWRALRSVP